VRCLPLASLAPCALEPFRCRGSRYARLGPIIALIAIPSFLFVSCAAHKLLTRLFSHPLLLLLQRLVYGSEAEAAVAIGFDDFIADGVRGTSLWQKPSVSIFCAAGEQGQRAKEVFMNTAKNFKFESFLESKSKKNCPEC